ncbi:hypothetical protein A2U01_0069529 [Trifolium medium]|uniref:Uncharacterized protein n=1 Tax=Trifolium medium TaxID=97028 RepID=A0A392SK85_9FABA|nr:hypothetical protein [Trifolium medium]
MNLRDAQKPETSSSEPLVTCATRHTAWRDAQLAETIPVLFPFFAQQAASLGATRKDQKVVQN